MHTKKRASSCPIEQLFELIGGKWKPVILWWLFESGTPARFTELRNKIGGITQKMLTQQLRELERDGLVRRKMFQEMPVRVEYSLTTFATELRPVMRALDSWARAHLPQRKA
jgi:DNA-binding HxlR family transcriptional regulator